MIITVLLAHGLIVLLPLVLLPVAVIHKESVPVPVAVAIPVAVEVPHVPVVAAVAQAEEDKN